MPQHITLGTHLLTALIIITTTCIAMEDLYNNPAINSPSARITGKFLPRLHELDWESNAISPILAALLDITVEQFNELNNPSPDSYKNPTLAACWNSSEELQRRTASA
jgi:hypothetical protein